MTNTLTALALVFGIGVGGAGALMSTDGTDSEMLQSNAQVQKAHGDLVAAGGEEEVDGLLADEEIGNDVAAIGGAVILPAEQVDQERVALAGERVAAKAEATGAMAGWTTYVQMQMPGASAEQVEETTRAALTGQEPGLAAIKAQLEAL